MRNDIQVKVPKNIRDIHEYVILNFNLKETVSAILIAIVTLSSFMIVSPIFGETIATFFMIILSFPIAFFGMFKWHGMAGYKVVFYILSYFAMPVDLKFSSKSKYRAVSVPLLSKKTKSKKEVKTESATDTD